MTDGQQAISSGVPRRLRRQSAAVSASLFNGVCLFAADCAALAAAASCMLALAALLSPALTGAEFSAFSKAMTDRWPTLAAAALAAAVWLHAHGHYTQRVPLWTELRELLTVAGFALALEALLQFALKHEASRLWVLGTWFLLPPFCILIRSAVKRALSACGTWIIPTAVFGRQEAVGIVTEALSSEPMLGYRVATTGRPGSAEEAMEIMMRSGARFAVIVLSKGAEPKMLAVAKGFSQAGMPFALAPPVGGLSLASMRSQFIFGHDVMLMVERPGLMRGPARLLKRAFDVCMAVAALAIASPFLAAIALLVASDGGPILFGHERVGLAGRRFKCLKFRTMVPDAAGRLQELLRSDRGAREEWERDHKLRNDPRLTRFGSFLRRSALDELPQLLNVVVGEMSLVGPRPIVTAELSRYGEDVDAYLRVRPGLTGLWQISGRNDLDYARRVALDTWYVANWSLYQDILICVMTLPALLTRRGAY